MPVDRLKPIATQPRVPPRSRHPRPAGTPRKDWSAPLLPHAARLGFRELTELTVIRQPARISQHHFGDPPGVTFLRLGKTPSLFSSSSRKPSLSARLAIPAMTAAAPVFGRSYLE